MTTIYLKYGSWSGGVATWSSATQYKALEFKETPVTKHLSGINLSQDEYVHVMNTKSSWNLVISANELAVPSKKTALINFYKSSLWKFSLDNIEYIEVVIPDGSMPIEDIMNNKHLPEVKLVFTKKEPD